MFRCATFEAINISQKPTNGYAWIHRNVVSKPTGQIWLSSILQTCQKNVTIVFCPNSSKKSDYCLFSKFVRDIYHLFSKLVRDLWLSSILQICQRYLTITYSPNFSEKSDYRLFSKLARKIWLSSIFQIYQRNLSPILQTCQKNLTAVYSPSKAEKADSVFHNFGEENSIARRATVLSVVSDSWQRRRVDASGRTFRGRRVIISILILREQTRSQFPRIPRPLH